MEGADKPAQNRFHTLPGRLATQASVTCIIFDAVCPRYGIVDFALSVCLHSKVSSQRKWRQQGSLIRCREWHIHEVLLVSTTTSLFPIITSHPSHEKYLIFAVAFWLLVHVA
jgi:hypothetical protein